jgi:very-short-patch-repair endonuclease
MARWSGAVEVTRPRRFRARDGIRCHRSAVKDDERTLADGIPVTSPFRTLIDLAAVLDRSGLRHAFNEIQVRQLTDAVPLPEMLARHRGRRGIRLLTSLVEEAAPVGVSRNEFEQTFMRLVEAAGLPLPRLNADLHVNGRFFEIDALWPSERLAVELDSRTVHGTAAAFEGDRRRGRALVADGYRTIHVTWRQLQAEPDAILADLRAALE